MDQRSVLRLGFGLWTASALLPVLAMLQRSLSPEGRFGLSSYTRIVASSRSWELLGATVGLAGMTALTAGAVGVPLAVCLARTDLPARRALLFLFTVPILLPPVVLAYGWFDAVGRDGWLERLAGRSAGHVLFSPAGCLIVLTATYLPIVLLFSVTALLSVNPRLEEAGRLSAPPLRVLLGVTLPQILPAFVAALLLVFCLSLGETTAPTFLRVNVYGAESLTQFAAFHDFGTATAAAVPLLAVTLLAFVGLRHFAAPPGGTIQAVSSEPRQASLRIGRGGPWVFASAALLWMGLAGAPLLALVLRSADFSAYAEAIGRTAASFVRSFLYAGLAASLIAGVGFLFGYGRARRSLSAWSEALPLFLFALPGSVLGIGLTSLWNRPGIRGVYGTPLVLLLGLLAQYTILAVWLSKSSVLLVPRSMEEAAAMAGASWPRRLGWITIPLSWKGLAAGWLLAFVFCLRDTGLALAVYPPGRDTAPVRLLTLMANGRPEMISAVCVLILLGAVVPFAILGVLFTRSRR